MKKLNIITLSLLTAVSLEAVTIPDIGDAIKQIKAPKIKQIKQEIPTIKSEPIPIKSFENNKKVIIKDIEVLGVVHLSQVAIDDIVAPYQNKELSFQDIGQLASTITKLYRDKGYFVAKAYIPQQNILTQDYKLTIKVIEGNYGEFILENSSLVKDSILQSNLDNIKEKNIVSTHTLERAMLIINDTPGSIVTKAEVKPGKKVGTSDFIIGTQATKKYSGYMIGDNYGSQFTGKHRLMVGADINSPFEIGDKLSFSGLSSKSSGLLNGRVAYQFPLYENGLRGEVSYSKTTYELGSSLRRFNYEGSSDSLSFKSTYPYLRSRLETLHLFGEIKYNDMEDQRVKKDKKDSYTLSIGADYTKDSKIFSKDGQTRATLTLTAGVLELKTKDLKDTDKVGANTDGNFYKLNLELGQDFELTPTIRWENNLQAQYALGDKNLDGSEDLSLGGIYGVKYYPDGEQSAENGYIYNTELFYTLPTLQGLNSSVSIFYDIGRTYMSKNITNEKSKTLQSFGLGYYGSYKDIFINAHLAHNIAYDVTSQDDYSNRILAQIGWVF